MPTVTESSTSKVTSSRYDSVMQSKETSAGAAKHDDDDEDDVDIGEVDIEEQVEEP